MISLKHRLRDHTDAGSLNSLIALWGFVDDEVVLTKAGHLALVYRLQPVDYEGLDVEEREALIHRFVAALKMLDQRFRVYQYLAKRHVSPLTAPPCANPATHHAIQSRLSYLNGRRHELYEIATHCVLLYEPADLQPARSTSLWAFGHPVDVIRGWLSHDTCVTILDRTLGRAVAHLRQAAMGFEVQLAELRPTRLACADAFSFFKGLLNYDPDIVSSARFKHGTHLDYFLADSAVECHRDHLDVGGHHVRLLTMKDPPAQTYAFMLEGLYGVPGELTACLEWQRLPSDAMRRDIQSRRRHWHNKRVSLINYVSEGTPPEDMLVDDSSAATVRQLGEALTDLEVHGHFFGECSLTVAAHGVDADRVRHCSAECRRMMAVHDGTLIEETYNGLNAWLAMIPGHGAQNVRRLRVLETNAADMSFLCALDQGATRSAHLQRESLAIFETTQRTLYHYDLHVDDVGHTVLFGRTGAGKSLTLTFLLTHLQRYDPWSVVFDFGRGFRKLAQLLQGSYLELGLGQQASAINPFCLPPTAENLHFLHQFVRLLLRGEDHYELAEAEDREIYEAVVSLYVLNDSQRRLFTLSNLLPKHLGRRLHRWVDAGRYAELFDNIEDTLTLSRCQFFDFQAMSAYPALLEPLLYYVLHRVRNRTQDPALAADLKVTVIDEASFVVRPPTVRAYTLEELKTSRKHNGVMLLATQSTDDFASIDLLPAVVNSCPTKLLLAGSVPEARAYQQLFGLTDAELASVTNLQPRGQLLLKRPGTSKVLELRVDPRSYWLYTNSPMDNDRFEHAVATHGFAGALDLLGSPVNQS